MTFTMCATLFSTFYQPSSLQMTLNPRIATYATISCETMYESVLHFSLNNDFDIAQSVASLHQLKRNGVMPV